jgi:hypothetical protein
MSPCDSPHSVDVEDMLYWRSSLTQGRVMELLTLGIVVFLGYAAGVFLIIRTAAMIRKKEEMLFGKQ